jgi:cell division protein FtsB
LLGFWERGTELPCKRKREPVTVMILVVLLGLEAAGTGTGIASLVTSQQNVQSYHECNAAISHDLDDLREGIDQLTDSLASLSEVVLQNRRGLDLLFLQQGGLCTALREECCVYVDKKGLVKESLAKIKASLEKRKRE